MSKNVCGNNRIRTYSAEAPVLQTGLTLQRQRIPFGRDTGFEPGIDGSTARSVSHYTNLTIINCREGRTRTCSHMLPKHAICQLKYFPYLCRSVRSRTLNLSIRNRKLYPIELQIVCGNSKTRTYIYGSSIRRIDHLCYISLSGRLDSNLRTLVSKTSEDGLTPLLPVFIFLLG